MQFQMLSLSAIEDLRKAFAQSRNRICDQTLGGAMMWRNGFRTQFCQDESCLYFKSEYEPGKWAYTAPVGDVKTGLIRLAKHCEEIGEELSFCSVAEADKDLILSMFPSYVATDHRDWSDYVYLAEKLRTLSGKKLSGQRNHRNFFVKQYPNWSFEEITTVNIDKAKFFFEEYSRNIQKDSPYFDEERKAVLEVMDHIDRYGFSGGMILIEGKVVAFSFGEIVGDTLFVHIEKADRQVRGAYQMMVSQFVSRFADETVLYVNREEDVGDPGLRYAKESYHPHMLLSKYTIQRSQ